MKVLTPTLLKQIYWQKGMKPFPAYLNLWSIKDDILVGVDLQMSLVYEFTGVDLQVKSEDEIEYFFNQIKNVLHSLHENMTMQIVVQVRRGDEKCLQEYLRNVNTEDEMSKFIVQEKTKHFRKLAPYKRRNLLYLTIYPENIDLIKMSPAIFKLLKPDYKKLAENLHLKYSQKLLDVANTITGQMKSVGIKLEQLNEEKIINFLYENLNPGRAENVEINYNTINKNYTLRSQIIYNACENHFAHCFIDGYYFRAVNMEIRPREISLLNLYDFLHLMDGEYDLCVSIHSVKQEVLIKQLMFDSTIATVVGNINPFKRYHEAEMKAVHCAELVEYVKNNYQKLFYLSFCVVIRDIDLQKLTERTNSCIANFRKLGEGEGIIDDMNHMYLYLSTLPNHSNFNMRKHIFHTDAVMQFIPLHQSWTGCKIPKALFLTRDHEMLPFDLFDPELPAKHSIVLGTTGSGKSFTTNFLLTNFYIESPNNHVIIVDIGGSYRKLCKLFNGEYLEIKLSKEYGFNPFPPKSVAIIDSSQENFKLDPDILSYLKLLVQKLLNREQLSGQEEFVIERAIINTYKYTKYDVPILSNLHYQLSRYTPEGTPETEENVSEESNLSEEKREERKLAKKFAADLQEWVSGVKGEMINRQTSLHPDARMIVFDLTELNKQKDLQGIVIFLIQNIIWNKLLDKNLRKMIVFDECWQLFNDPISAQLVENLYRTARKYNALVLSISQSPEDFLGSKSSQAVLTNSYVKYILRLQKGFEILNKLGFTEQEIELIKSLESIRGKYSEIAIKFMDKIQILKLLVSKTDYWICTTDPEDYKIENSIRQKNPGTELEILKILSTGG